jgi:hypothetical protein
MNGSTQETPHWTQVRRMLKVRIEDAICRSDLQHLDDAVEWGLYRDQCVAVSNLDF